MATRPESMMIQGGPKEYKQRAIQEARSAQDAIDRLLEKNNSSLSGKYQFRELIGKGSYGRVYKSLETKTGRTVAIKVLTPDDSDLNIPAEARDTNLQDALKEINILERLRQSGAKNVNQFIEAFTVHSQLWLVSEYCSGGSLSTLKRAAGGKLKEEFIRTIARELALGLASVHRAGIVHRDVKCANVMISESGGVQIIDFGVSAVLMSNLEEDKRKTIIGTPHWMAPELQQAPDKEVPHGSEVDVWAFGITLYECAMGYPPNATVTQQARLRHLLRQQPPRLPEDKFSAELRDLVAFVLNPDPKGRPTMQNISEHPYLQGSEAEFPTSSLKSLVESYYNWERGGGQRASLWYGGGAAPANVHQKPEQDEWVFSTTAAFDRMHGDEDDLSFGLSSSPPRESEEWDEEPALGRTLRPEAGSINESDVSTRHRSEQEEQARRGEKHLEGIFDQSATPYSINGKTNDLPLRPGNTGSSFHTQELDVSLKDEGPNINLDTIDSKKASRRATMAWKWGENLPKLEQTETTSVKRPSVTAQSEFSLGNPVNPVTAKARDTLDLDSLLRGDSSRNSSRNTLDLDSLMNAGVSVPSQMEVPPVPSVPVNLPSHSQRPSFQDPRNPPNPRDNRGTLDLDDLWGDTPQIPVQKPLGDPFSFKPSVAGEQTMRPASQFHNANMPPNLQAMDFAAPQPQQQFYPFDEGGHHGHKQDIFSQTRPQTYDFDGMSNGDLDNMIANDHVYQAEDHQTPMTDDEASSLASQDFSSMNISGPHSRNQSGSVGGGGGGGLASSPPTSPFGIMQSEQQHQYQYEHQHQQQLLHHQRGISQGNLPPVPQFPHPVNPAALVDGADKGLIVAEMRRLLTYLGGVQDVALALLDEKDRRTGATAADVAAADADTESIHGSATEADDQDGVAGDDECLEMKER